MRESATPRRQLPGNGNSKNAGGDDRRVLLRRIVSDMSSTTNNPEISWKIDSRDEVIFRLLRKSLSEPTGTEQ